MRRLLVCSALALMGGCGGGSDDTTDFRTIAFSNGYGVANTYSYGLIGHLGSFPEGWFPDCMDCARVIAVAQDRESAERALGAGPMLAALDQVNFANSTVIVFDRVVVGTTYQFKITAIEERATELTLRSFICAVKEPVVANGFITGFVVVAKTTKPASFARSETSSKPPVVDGLRRWGEC